MEMENKPMEQPMQPQAAVAKAIGPEQLQKFMQILQQYKTGKTKTENRIVASENWWKLRNTMEEQKETNIGADGGFTSKSGWLHNVIVSKHADAMESYPEPNILPREQGDKQEAKSLSDIIPCILEQNNFEATYSDAMWQKFKSGTGCYKVVWDNGKLNGLGDIAVECVNLLNVYWEPGITDIQKSRFFFHTELVDKELLAEQFPEIADKLKGQTFTSTKFLYDDTVSTENKHTVIEVYYHKYVQGKKTLQYCKFVEGHVLYATENETQRPTQQAIDPVTKMPVMVETGPSMAEAGLYDHGMYPYVFDPLFPIWGSPCGYGFVDLCSNPQTEIDLMKTSIVKNVMAGATPRYLSRQDGNVNEEEFLDLSKPIVHVHGNVDEASIRQIGAQPLDDGLCLNTLNITIQELRETSGNTETSTGNVGSGVTAASAIAALQEASGKGSRDSTKSAYRAYTKIVELCIELIRQFYNLPRQFRIIGQYGAEEYVSYSNEGIQPQHQGTAFGQDMGYRLPVFDVKISAQQKSVYTKVAQNELAIQFFQLGFFNPQLTDQTLMCLEMMEFDGKDGIMQKVAQNGTMFQKLVQYMQLALSFAQVVQPQMAEQIAQDIMQTMGGMSGGGMAASGGSSNPFQQMNKENAVVSKARARSNSAAQPAGNTTRKENKR